jgi:hypothetical protein
MLTKELAKHFGNYFYLVRDSALQNSPMMVASFKAPKGHALQPDEEKFNTILGKLSVTSEHTIGILKAHFPFLHSILMVIMDHKNLV